MTRTAIVSNNPRATLIKEQGKHVSKFIEEHVLINGSALSIVLDTSSYLDISSIRKFDNLLHSVINIKRLNDVRFINKFLEESNKVLCQGGLFVGRVAASHIRKNRILNKYRWPFNRVVYFFDYLIKRVSPKLSLTKKIYFFLTQGKSRVISDMEAFGRLYSCGFEVVDSKEINGDLWIVGRKQKAPAFNNDVTYGPLIKLKRHGKYNKLFTIYKIRTMYPYSEYLQEYVSSKYGLQKGGKFFNDPRVTTVGKFLRKFWLDELPMFLNIFKGQMKLVGVRPLSSQYFSLYPEHLKELRSKVKPGLVPPFYADLPETLGEIIASEEVYIKSYLREPLLTDIRYFCKAAYNIIFKGARSK